MSWGDGVPSYSDDLKQEMLARSDEMLARSDELRAERDEARAEVDRLRALCDRVREARKTAPLLHTFHCARGPTEECACGIGELRAAIEALGPGGGK